MQKLLSMNVPIRQSALLIARAKHAPLMPHWLTHLGGPGLFFVAILDSSPIPLPLPGSTDLLLVWLVAFNGNPWLLTLSAIAGSILGGYTTWSVGRKGGEAALQRYVPARILRRIVGWTKHNSILAVFLPALLPPPIPLTPFLLASGALGVSRGRFLPVYSAARALRYSLVAWLAVTYGRHAIHLWSKTLQRWSTPLISVFVGLLVVGICLGTWKFRKLRKIDTAEKHSMRASAARAG